MKVIFNFLLIIVGLLSSYLHSMDLIPSRSVTPEIPSRSVTPEIPSRSSSPGPWTFNIAPTSALNSSDYHDPFTEKNACEPGIVHDITIRTLHAINNPHIKAGLSASLVTHIIGHKDLALAIFALMAGLSLSEENED